MIFSLNFAKKPSFWLDYVDNEKTPQIQIYFTQYLNWYTCISTYIYKHTSRKTKATPHIMIDSILYSISCISDWLLLKTCKCTWFHDAIFCHMTTYGGQPWAGRRWPLHHVMWLTSWSVWLCPPLYSSGTSHWWCLQL